MNWRQNDTRRPPKGDTKNEGQEDQEHIFPSDLPTLYVYPLIPNDAELERASKNKEAATAATLQPPRELGDKDDGREWTGAPD